MATVNVDPTSVVEFVDEAAFNDWLARHHDQRKKVWVSEQNCFALAFRVFNLKTEAIDVVGDSERGLQPVDGWRLAPIWMVIASGLSIGAGFADDCEQP